MQIRIRLFLLSIISSFSLNAQSIIWGTSENYQRLRDDTSYHFCYKLESVYKPTKIFYEMVSVGNFNNEIVIENVDYENEPIVGEPLRIRVGNKDTLIFSDTMGCAIIKLLEPPQEIWIRIFPKPNGFYVRQTRDYLITSKIKLLWGSAPGGRCILTIFSKKKLEEIEIMEMESILFSGNSIESDEFYYYFSEE